MNCESCIEKLDDWLDGELSPAESHALEAHAGACVSCGATLEAARRLQREARALPAREPSRDLWPGIAARLEKRAPDGREQPWLRALAAGVAVVAVFAGGMLAHRVMQQDVTPQVRETRQVRAADELPSLADARRILPATYVELVEGGSGSINTGAEHALLRNLLVVNLAIREIETALAEDPANADLRELLSGLYAQENRILAQAERLQTVRQVPTRTAI